MGWGDEVLAAGQAQRLYEADPSRRVAICGQDGAVRWHPIWEGNPILAHPRDVAAGERVQRLTSGPGCRPYIVYPFTPESGWTFNQAFKAREHIARIYLTEDELARGTQARARYGPFVLIEPYTNHQNFAWPLAQWQALVDACPDLTFVQHTHPASEWLERVHHEPATFREACGLLTTARAYIRSESGMCHAAAALGRPTVTLWGGCMDVEVMGGYPLQVSVKDDGPGSPCGRWRTCPHCTAVMAGLTVERVAAALRQALAMRQAERAA